MGDHHPPGATAAGVADADTGDDAPDPDDDARVPTGLVLFAPGTPARFRRRRLIFLGVWAAGWVSLLWPVYAWFAGPRPMILGMPPAMAWSTLWMVVLLAALAWLYLGDRRSTPDAAAAGETARDPR